MSTTMTPPAPQQPAPVPDAPRPSASSRVIAILVIVLGGLIVLGAICAAAVSTVLAASVQTTTRTVSVVGVDSLDVDLAAGTLRVEFADVEEAELEVTSAFGADRWTLRTDDGELDVASPDDRVWMGWVFGGNGDAVLRLPRSLEGVDTDLGLAAGELIASGDFGVLDLELGAGRAEVDGSANQITADVSAGRADLDLADVRTAEMTVSAGELRADLTGSQPQSVTIDVSAGSLSLTVPEGSYDVTSDVSAGRFDNRIGSTPGADSSIDVRVSAGSATLRGSD